MEPTPNPSLGRVAFRRRAGVNLQAELSTRFRTEFTNDGSGGSSDRARDSDPVGQAESGGDGADDDSGDTDGPCAKPAADRADPDRIRASDGERTRENVDGSDREGIDESDGEGNGGGEDNGVGMNSGNGDGEGDGDVEDDVDDSGEDDAHGEDNGNSGREDDAHGKDDDDIDGKDDDDIDGKDDDDREDGYEDEDERYVTVRLGDYRVALPVDTVDTVTDPPESVGSIPRSPPAVDGVADLRGEITAILDPRVHFGADADTTDERLVVLHRSVDQQPTAIRVDEVLGVDVVPDQNVVSPTEAKARGIGGNAPDHPLVSAIIETSDQEVDTAEKAEPPADEHDSMDHGLLAEPDPEGDVASDGASADRVTPETVSQLFENRRSDRWLDDVVDEQTDRDATADDTPEPGGEWEWNSKPSSRVRRESTIEPNAPSGETSKTDTDRKSRARETTDVRPATANDSQSDDDHGSTPDTGTPVDFTADRDAEIDVNDAAAADDAGETSTLHSMPDVDVGLPNRNRMAGSTRGETGGTDTVEEARGAEPISTSESAPERNRSEPQIVRVSVTPVIDVTRLVYASGPST